MKGKYHKVFPSYSIFLKPCIEKKPHCLFPEVAGVSHSRHPRILGWPTTRAGGLWFASVTLIWLKLKLPLSVYPRPNPWTVGQVTDRGSCSSVTKDSWASWTKFSRSIWTCLLLSFLIISLFTLGIKKKMWLILGLFWKLSMITSYSLCLAKWVFFFAMCSFPYAYFV